MRLHVYAKLQATDQRLAALAHERDLLLAQFDERELLRALRVEQHQLTSQLRAEHGISSDLHWSLEELERRLHGLEEIERDGPTDPLVARELVMLREQRSQLEERVLRQLDRIALLEAEAARQNQQIEERERAWNEQEPQLQDRLDRLGRDLEALQVERMAIAGRLPERAAALYDELQRRHRGTALAVIRNRQCSVCHARLPSAVFDLLSAADPLVRCPRCGRVLYLPEQADQP